MDDTLAAALAEETATRVTKATVPEALPPLVDAALPGLVDEGLPGLVDERVAPLVVKAVALEYRANPPLDGKPGLSIKGDKGDPGISVKGDPGPQGDPGEDGRSINWRGTWRRGQYQPLDAVEQDGSSYIATAPTRSSPPGPGWDLMAQKGEPGKDSQHGGYTTAYPKGGFGVQVLDHGTSIGPESSLNFLGAGVTVTPVVGIAGRVDLDFSGGGGGSSLTVLDEGVVLDTAVTSIDIVGNLTATNIGHAVTITAPADLVTSVNGQTGVVVLDAGDVGADVAGAAAAAEAAAIAATQVTVTDGTTTINPATTLTLPSGSVSDGGGGDAIIVDVDEPVVDPGTVWPGASQPVVAGQRLAVSGDEGLYVYEVVKAGTTGSSFDWTD